MGVVLGELGTVIALFKAYFKQAAKCRIVGFKGWVCTTLIDEEVCHLAFIANLPH